MKNRMRRGVLVTVLAMLAAACGARGESGAAAPADPIAVRVAPAIVQRIPRRFEAGGIIKARMTAQMSARVAAELRAVKVEPGQRVRKGQVLAVLDDRDLSAHREQAHASLSAARNGAASAEAARQSAEAGLTLAQSSYRRIEQLRQKNAATPQELDRATADLQMAEAAVRAATARHAEATASISAADAATRAADVTASFSTITAPFDGIVTSTPIEPGNMVSPGMPLLSLESVDGFRLEIQVDEARARFLQMDRLVDVQLDSGRVTGRLVEIARAMDPVSHAFIAKIQLPADAAVRSGMFGRAQFDADPRDALVVPASAIVRRGQLSLVFIAGADNRARMRAITAGAATGDGIEVLAGVQAGEHVILNPPPSLHDGAPVRSVGGQS